ncbi:substrate-binding periplasmic protein [Bdellovibrio bacteriovorus]|uniref:substrate-binding periplasmic protein n=1 Tax=Bdellovibrio TaxID=958 RepID=UPI0035A96DC7
MKYVLTILLLFPIATLASSPPLLVGFSEVGPFAYMENGKLVGINHDILSRLAEESGLTFKYSLYPHARMINSLEASSSDLAVNFSVTCQKYPKNYEIQNILYSVRSTLYLKSSVDMQKMNPRIGRLRGTCTELISKYVKPEMLTEVSSMEQALEMLTSNRLQGVCGLSSVIKFYAQKIGFQEKLVVYQTSTRPLDAVICRKKSLPEGVKKKLEDAAKKLKKVSIEE